MIDDIFLPGKIVTITDAFHGGDVSVDATVVKNKEDAIVFEVEPDDVSRAVKTLLKRYRPVVGNSKTGLIIAKKISTF